MTSPAGRQARNFLTTNAKGWGGVVKFVKPFFALRARSISPHTSVNRLRLSVFLGK